MVARDTKKVDSIDAMARARMMLSVKTKLGYVTTLAREYAAQLQLEHEAAEKGLCTIRLKDLKANAKVSGSSATG